MDAEGDREFLAISEGDIFEEARDRLQIAVEAETDNRNRAKYDLEFREGLNHWDKELVTSESMGSPELTINLTDALVHRVVNNMKQQRPRGKCHPVGDNANVETAEIINGIGRHVEYRSEASVAYDCAGDMAVTVGWGWVRLFSEYVAPDSFDQDIRIAPIRNIFTVYADPGAVMPTACDMDWCLITIKMKRTEYKRQYPRMNNTAWNDTGRDEWRIDWEDKEEIRLAEYFRIREKTAKLYLLKNQQGQEFTRFYDELPSAESLAAAGLEHVMDGDKPMVRDSSRRQVEWFRLNGIRVVDRAILPGTWIPVVRCEGNAVNVDGKIMRRGMVRAMIDPQRMVDYGEVAKIRRLGLTPQAPWVGAEGQFDGHPEWDKAANEPYTKLIYKPVTVQTDQGEQLLPPPQRQQPAQLEAGFAEFTNGMRSNLLAVANMQSDPGQDTQGEVVSGIAQRRRDKNTDQGHFQYYDNQTLMIAQVWRIMLEWVPHYMSERRMQRILGEDGVPKMVALNDPVEEQGIQRIKNDVTVGRYDVVMETGPGYETKREEGAETLLGMLQSQPIAETLMKIAPDLIFRSIDHPYMQEIADRFSAMTPDGLKQVMAELPERAKSVVTALANENAQLKQALQAAQSGITKAHLAAEVKAHDTEMRTRASMHDTDVKAGTAVFVEGMRHGHEVKMAEAEARRLVNEGESNGSSRTGQ
jgi:hypothetical protein